MELENIEVVVKAVSGIYSYVIPGNEYQEAARILKASIGDLISADDSAKPLTHKMGVNDDGDRALISVCETAVIYCQSIVDFETNQRCGAMATVHDDNFAYPLCDRCATIAYNCMDVDAAMLQNAY